MIISRTPYRISFFGGGTDYPKWFGNHGGAVLATTINKYCYLTCRYLPPFFEHKHRIVWSRIETCNHLDDIQHPSVREVLRVLDIDRGVEVHHVGDLPARSGMGSSSAFTVGFLHAIHALKGQMPTKEQLAQEGIHLEQGILRETVGSQDQVMAAYGGFNHVRFFPNGEFVVHPVILSQGRFEELNSHLMLFYTGIKRTASNVAESYVQDLAACKQQLCIMQRLVDESLSILNSQNPISDFGELLHEAWQVKRSLSDQVSNSFVDHIYSIARGAGALGGKLLGAGGGGFFLVFAPPAKQASIREALKELIHVPFKFDVSGSRIIAYNQEEEYPEESAIRNLRSTGAFRELCCEQGMD